MASKTLIVIETESAFVQEFEKALRGQFVDDKYSIIQIVPEVTDGLENMIEKCMIGIEKTLIDNDVSGFYVDLSISSKQIDKLGISLGMAIREKYPQYPIFSITNKNIYDDNFDNLSDATLEDFDGVFEKNYLVGKDFSKHRLETMLKKAAEKRTKIKVPVKKSKKSSQEIPLPIKCDVAIISALFDYEFEQIQLLVDINKNLSKSLEPDSLKIGKLRNSNLKVVIDYQKKMGLVDAAILSSTLLTKYTPKLLVMTGVCGGRMKKDVKIGDIIVPSEVYDYQTGKLDNGKFKPYHYRAVIDDDLISKIRNWKLEILRQMEDDAEIKKDRIKLTNVHFDVMASGGLVIKTDGALDYISESFDEKTVAVEMESYSVARSCNIDPFKNHSKAIIIKASMDGSDKDKTDIDKEWAAHVSSKFTYYFLKKLEAEGYFK